MKKVEWDARWCGGMKEAAVKITAQAVVPQEEFARHIRHISGGSELYRAEAAEGEDILFLYQSGSGKTREARSLLNDRTWDSWDEAELSLNLPEGCLEAAFYGERVEL